MPKKHTTAAVPRIPMHTSLPLPSSIRQIDGLQILRAVAVILVAWLHAGEVFLPAPIPILPNAGVFGIDIFFVISGFILCSVVMRERGAPGIPTMWNFLKRRWLRIFPIYWLLAGLILVRFALAHLLFRYNYLPIFFLLPTLRYPDFPLILGASWTLIFEMLFYYVLALLLLASVRYAVPLLVLVLMVSVSIGAAAGIGRPVWVIICNPILLEFVFGAIIALAYRRLQRQVALGRAIASAGVVLSLFLAAYPPQTAANGLNMVLEGTGVFMRVGTWGVAALLLVGGVIFWSPVPTGRFGKLFVVLGNASYSTYLLSAIVIEWTSRLLLRLGGMPLSVRKIAVYQSSILLAVMVFGWLCYDLVEWPMTRALQRRLIPKRT